MQYYHRIQEILAEDQPMIFLYSADALPVVSSRVRGIEPGPAGIIYNFIDWFVPEATAALYVRLDGALRPPPARSSRSRSCIGITFISFLVIQPGARRARSTS